ncbi:MAG: AraC family transcriptional regulator [Bacteroidota bacterium]
MNCSAPQSEAPKHSAEHYPKVYLYRRIVQAKLFIDRNYADKIDLNNISDEAYFSKFHFIRLFKTIYGKTPHQYLTAVRIAKSQELLKAGHPVTEVCFAVGFDSLTSFSALFKRVVGVSPSVYLSDRQMLKFRIQRTPKAFIPSCYLHQHGWLENSNFEEVNPS